MNKLEKRIRKELAAQKAKPTAQHHIAGYQQNEFARGRLYEVRARQEYAVYYREQLLKKIAGKNATEHKVRVRYGKLYAPKTFAFYRVDGKDVLLVNKRGSSNSAFKVIDLEERAEKVTEYFLAGQAKILD